MKQKYLQPLICNFEPIRTIMLAKFMILTRFRRKLTCNEALRVALNLKCDY